MGFEFGTHVASFDISEGEVSREFYCVWYRRR